MKKIIALFKENKVLFISLLILFLVLSYASFNTFLANDDLAYSFFRRLNVRVTNLYQVVWDNLRYYKSLNGRFLVHCIVMTLLIFGKNVWSVLNPLVIVSLLSLIYSLIIKKRNTTKLEKAVVALLLPVLYLLLFEYKGLTYWVAGSINYLWVTFFLFVFLYLYLNKNLNKKVYYLLVFILSTLHENSFVFLVAFFIVLNIIEYIKTKKLPYLKYFIPVILGGCILLLAPGNISRTNSFDEWNSLNLLDKLNLSIPTVSNFAFKLFNINNLVPTIYILIILIRTFMLKTKREYKITAIVSLFLGVLISLSASNYGTFALAIIAFCVDIFLHYVDKDLKYIPIQIGFYAVSFSMILTPLYYYSRGCFSLNIYFIFISSKYLLDFLKSKRIITILMIIILTCSNVFLLYKEIDIYYHIGVIHESRIKSIEEFKKQNDSRVLYLKTIPKEYEAYHIDANIMDENYFTYPFFLWYYDLPEGTIIKFN